MKSTFGDNRMADILQYFVRMPEVVLSVLSSRLDVSERTVRNDIHQINRELEGCAAIEGAQGKYRLYIYDQERLSHGERQTDRDG